MNASDHPLASVVIPNWNGAHHLPVCLDALQGQTYPHMEVILVDNGSTDGSQALVKERYPGVRLLALESNLGLTGGNNAGFGTARGEILRDRPLANTGSCGAVPGPIR